jgi:lysophospholipase L1-like esterase
MTANNQITTARLVRAIAVTVFVAVQTIFALHTNAYAQVINQLSTPAHFVAPVITTVAALASTPGATPAVAMSGNRPVSLDETKHAAVLPTAPLPSPAIACNTSAEFTHLDRPLLHSMRTLANGEPLTVVAIGSSSTAGAGASSPAASYPSRLATELRQRFPNHDILVLNRGVNGEETDNMMARFAGDVFAAHPQLVIWQVGTNSVLRDRPLDKHSAELHEGIDELKATGADVVLVDLQYSPAVIAKSETSDMVEQIALTAKEKNVDLFRRFAAMRDWREKQHLAFDTFVSPDGLHMNDWGYGCMAKLLGSAIGEAAMRPVASAAAHSAR